ncbi:glycosyltransferase [[Limnothrix rosea] IAM M-220]|uniref:glycosyltransferase n=1 Tax=[Limnothrix rosea] IAM M-220 TaxID=454133 RepID=UPI000961F123|nr:glycosyltransferase [[Limnothrix rosea] IAM M-220]OKH15150.1 hypothetical protein NIES208_13230 [[Limnothrix rosea] IAM M-220]
MSPLLQNYSDQDQFQFSIVIPLGDRLTDLEKCIASICQQQHQGQTEILLLDDASQTFNLQDLELIFEQYSVYLNPEKYTIHYIRHPQCLGEYANLNWGLKCANSPWIYFVCDDNLLLENTLLWFEEIIEKQPSLDLISGAFYTINKTDEILEKSEFLANSGLVDQGFLNRFLAENPLQSIATIYHKRLFKKIGYFNLDLGKLADWEFYRRVTKIRGLNWYYLPQYIGAYRQEPMLKSPLATINVSDKAVWQVLKLSQKYFSPVEQRISRKSRYWQCFGAVDGYFIAGQIDQAISICLGLVDFSGLGDRLWLEVLNQYDFKYKQQIYELMLILTKQVAEAS